MRKRRLAVGLLLLGGIVGCTVGPNYRMPDVGLPATWSEVPQNGVTTQSLQIAQWWKMFNDPGSMCSIQRAVQSNLDLHLAAARVRESRALACCSSGPVADHQCRGVLCTQSTQ